MGKESGDDIIEDARERFSKSQSDSDGNRVNFRDDVHFARMGEQWPADVKKQRQLEGRPCLTVNKLPSFIRNVVNESRQNKPGIKVSPVDNGADVETAEVISGLIRSIERSSDSEIAYDTAIDNAVSGGFGFFRVTVDYAGEDSFDLCAKIERIPNALMVHWDTSSTAFDASDWEFAFVSDLLSEEEFETRYPKAKPVSFDGIDDFTSAKWADEDRVRVAEYWLREEKNRDIVMLSDGRVVRADDLPNIAKNFFAAGGIALGGQVKDDQIIQAAMQATGLTEIRRRTSKYNEVTRRIISGVEVLSEEVWPGSTIPICPVWGEEVFFDGRREFRSMIRDARDPQSMFNFWRSASTELVALAPRAPWVGPLGFVPKGHESKWGSANTRSHAYLEFDPSSGGAPQRQPFSGVPAGAIQEAMNASDDIKAITGIYDSSMGARSNETSGKAILARERQGNISNFHFVDNLSRAIRYAGRILVEIIPSVYGPRETIRILGEDSKEKVVKLTQEAGGSIQAGVEGEQRLYDLSVGRYDVTVSAGPSSATQREDTREALVEIMRQLPGSAAYIGDVLMEHMDFQGADKVAKRLKHLLPPAIQQAEGIAPPPQPPAPDAAAQEEAAMKKRELDIKAYDAETKRIAATSAVMDPQSIQALVLQTIQQVLASPDILPGQEQQIPAQPHMAAAGQRQDMPEMPMAMGRPGPGPLDSGPSQEGNQYV